MIKKIGAVLMCAVFGYNAPLYATTMQALKPGMGIEYTFLVNEPQILVNPIIFTIKASCTINSENEENLLSFTVLKKSGSFNGTKLMAGDNMSYVVHNDETISITALPGAQVELINLGEETMVATCSVA
jgi:hypothetical protein